MYTFKKYRCIHLFMVWYNPTTWFSKPTVTTTTIAPVVVTAPTTHGTPISSPVPTPKQIATTPTYVPSTYTGSSSSSGTSYIPREFIPKPGLPTPVPQPTPTPVPIPDVFKPQPNRINPGTSTTPTPVLGTSEIPREFLPRPNPLTPTSRTSQITPSSFQQTGVTVPSSMVTVSNPTANFLGTGVDAPSPRYNLDLFRKAGREIFLASEEQKTPLNAIGTLFSPIQSLFTKKKGDIEIQSNVFGTTQDDPSTSPLGSGAGRTTTGFDILKTQAVINPNLLVPSEVLYQREAEKISKGLSADIQGKIDTGTISFPEAEKEFETRFQERVGKIDTKQFTPSISYKERVREGGQSFIDVAETAKFGAFVAGSFTPVGQVAIGGSLLYSAIPKLGKGTLGTDLSLKERGILLGTGAFEAGLGLTMGGGAVRTVERQADKLLVEEALSLTGTTKGVEFFKANDFTLLKTRSVRSLGEEARIETGLVSPLFKTTTKNIVKKSEFGIPTIVEKGKDVYSLVGGRGNTISKIWSTEKGAFIESEATFGFTAPDILSGGSAKQIFGSTRVPLKNVKPFGGNLKIVPKESKTFFRNIREERLPVFFTKEGSKTKFSSILKVKRDVKSIFSETKGGKVMEKPFGGITEKVKIGDRELMLFKGGDIVGTTTTRRKIGQFIFEKPPVTKVKVTEQGAILLAKPPKVFGDTGINVIKSGGKKTPFSATFQEQVTPATEVISGIATRSLIKPAKVVTTTPTKIGGGTITKTIPQQKVRTSQFQTAITSTGLDTGLKERQRLAIKTSSVSRSKSSTLTKLAPASAFAQPTALREKVVSKLQQKSRQIQQQKQRQVQPLISPIKSPRGGGIGKGSLRGFRFPNLNLNLRVPKQTARITRSRKRKPVPRTPSLFAIGRGIKSTGVGSLETSGLTIRPIIISKRRKKSGKKKKR